MRFRWVNGFGEDMDREVLAKFVHQGEPWVVVLDRAGEPVSIPVAEGEILY